MSFAHILPKSHPKVLALHEIPSQDWSHGGTMSFQRGVLLSIVLLIGCEGQIGAMGGARLAGGDSDVGSQSGSLRCEVADTAFQPLRRLSSRQIENTLRDLFEGDLGDAIAQIASVPDTEIRSGFSTDADANIVNSATSARSKSTFSPAASGRPNKGALTARESRAGRSVSVAL